jgi:hypothetical protein
LTPFGGTEGKMSLGQWLEHMARIATQQRGDTRNINLQARLDDWYRRYERAVIRGGKAVTITFEESMGFEELFFKGENE